MINAPYSAAIRYRRFCTPRTAGGEPLGELVASVSGVLLTPGVRKSMKC